MTLLRLPDPPYYAVVFSGERTEIDDGYAEMLERMKEMAAASPGYLGFETALKEDGASITISYWESEEAIANWKRATEHREAQRRGRAQWYEDYTVRVAKVERAYAMKKTSIE